MRNAIVNSIRQSIRQSIRGSEGVPAPSLFLGLQDSLQPTMSNTVNPGAFTRATEATYYDHEGLVRTAKSGQARMVGSRVVENLITASEDMTNAAYATANNALVDSATQATFDGTTNGTVQQSLTITDDGSGASGRTFVFSVSVSLVSGTITANSAVEIRIAGDAITVSGRNIGDEITSTPKRFFVAASTDAAGTVVQPKILVDEAITLEITKWQLEEVTGQTNQNPSEYVSAGVGTGAELYTVANALANADNNADATTGLSSAGSPPTFESQQLEVPLGYTNAIHIVSDSAGQRFTEDLDAALSLVDGKDYALAFWARHTGSGDNWRIALDNQTDLSSGSETVIKVLSSSDTTWKYYQASFTHSGDTQYFGAREIGANTGGVYMTGLTIREADHGLGVDGVKAFTTLNGNTVSNGVVTEATGPAVNQQWVEFDGASGTYVSTPDNAAFPTGDVTVIWGGAPTDWTPAAAGTLVSKWVNAGSQKSLALRLETDGTLKLFATDDGATTVNHDATSSEATGFAGGTFHWVRVTFSPTSNTVDFYTSDDPRGTSPLAVNWTQLGSQQGLASAISSIHDGTAPIEIGANENGTNSQFAGKAYRAVVIDSTDPTATPVVDFNANDYDAGKTWETQSQKNTTNLVTNGAFDSDFDGWDAGTDWSVVSGKAVDSGTSADVSARKLVWETPLTAGKKYRYSFEASDVSGGNPSLVLSSDLNLTNITAIETTSGDGTYTGVFTATDNRTYLAFTGATATWKLDNVSVIELPDVWTLNGNANVVSPLARWGDFPGGTGDNFTTPDSAATSITGDHSIVAWAAPDEWSDGVESRYILSKDGSTQRSYGLGVSEFGTLRSFTSNNGTTNVEITDSTASVPFADGVGGWVGMSWDADGDVCYYTSTDPFNTPYSQIAWTQLGDAVSKVNTVVNDSTSDLEIGTLRDALAANRWNGKIARAAVIASTDLTATPVADFDARTFTPGVSTATAPTGETWTANGNVSIEQNIPSNWDSDGPLGYLAEESRTNIALYSTPGDLGTTWTDTNATPAANYAVAPDGSKTAVRLVDDGATGTGNVILQQAVSVASGADYTFSVHLKADQLTWVNVRAGAFDSNVSEYFDLANGVAGTSGEGSPTIGIVPVGNGWYRCWIVFSSTTDLDGVVQIYAADSDGDRTVALDGTSSILVWGAQIEAGAFPTSYIPTTTTSVTRNADVLTYDGSGVTFPMTMSADYVGTNTPSSNAVVASVSDGSSSNRVELLHKTDDVPRAFVSTAGVAQANIDANTAIVLGSTGSITAAVATNDAEVYLDGAGGETDASVTVPTGILTVHVGQRHDETVQPNGTIRKVKVFGKRLTDALIKNL